MTTNYEIIGIAFRDTPESGEKFLCERRLPKVGQYSGELKQTKLVHRVRQTDLGILLAILIGRHLGAEPTTANSEVATQGSSLAQEYFTGTWPEEDARDREALDKTPSNPGLMWFEPFRNGLLLVLLANRLDVVRSLADWTESWLVPEARAIPIEPLLGKWMIALVSDFRSSPLAGKEALEAELAKSRKRAPKLLFQAWQAVRDQNQKAFDKAFVTSVDHFDKGEGNKAECLDDLVGIHQSILLAAARHKGMQVPQMTERQKARVVTHESLGLPAPSSNG